MPQEKTPAFRDRAKHTEKGPTKQPRKAGPKGNAKMTAKRPAFADGGDVKIPLYNIIDKKTGQIVGTAMTLQGARRSVDRRDNEYGAYRFGIQRIGSGLPRI